jgi:hypothetical protein
MVSFMDGYSLEKKHAIKEGTIDVVRDHCFGQ